jgi:curved DNA-binding protein CbpA
LALAVKLHPDKNGGDKSFEEEFKKVNAAYQTLGDKYKRQIYDNKLNYYKANPNSKTSSNQNQGTTSPEKPDFNPPPPTYTYQAEEDFNIKNMFLAISFFLFLGTMGYFVYVFMQNYSAKHHYENALEAIKKEHWSEAYSELSESLNFKTDDATVYALRAEVSVK